MKRLIWLLIFAVTACSRAEPLPAVDPQLLPLSVQPSANAGEPVTVSAGPVVVADGAPLHLVWIGSYGPQVIHGEFLAGMAEIVVPASVTQHAGAVRLIGTTPGYVGEASLVVAAGPPVEPVTPLVGARSIVADGEHWSMTVVVPFDAFGNPVANGTPVTIKARHPGARLEVLESEVERLVAWERIWSGTVAGRTVIAVEADGVPGPEGVLEEVAGPPVPFTLLAQPAGVPADGRQLVTVRTSTIHDRFGNVMPDGTQVTFLVEDANGTRRTIPGYTLDGSAEIPLQAASTPQRVAIRATAFGVTSPYINYRFTPLNDDFSVTATVREGSVWLEAGPLLGALGQYVPDGTQVSFEIEGDNGVLLRTEGIVDGGQTTASVRLALLAPGEYTVVASSGSATGSASFIVEDSVP